METIDDFIAAHSFSEAVFLGDMDDLVGSRI